MLWARELQRNVVYLGWPIAPSYRLWALMRGGGGGCGASANEYSCAHGAPINFGDLTPYITYGISCHLVTLQLADNISPLEIIWGNQVNVYSLCSTLDNLLIWPHPTCMYSSYYILSYNSLLTKKHHMHIPVTILQCLFGYTILLLHLIF